MKQITCFLILTLVCTPLLSCSNAGKGAAIGAAGGGIIGGVADDNTVRGVLIGAMIGGVAGAIIGSYMDDQARELEEDLEGARVERVGEGIQITFDSGLLFAVDKAELSAEARANLVKMAGVLKKYEKTDVLLEGHTDNTGSDDYNMGLSERRAEAVARFLSANGVNGNRFTVVGYGESQPIASNEDSSGRAMNRRVEVAIIANDELKDWAEDQAE
ncbi:MAG: OmpA family protein [Candidatus Eisenbacteria bacterium]|uniref:OmpA family protein n=1 Tax=Eiseniibacteriota bacterium TaxID=2212470 RepID=A0A7Y2H2V7_UNCEI|nr:OmpA family protein [Candidatus Eisenbacteria bacterium]